MARFRRIHVALVASLSLSCGHAADEAEPEGTEAPTTTAPAAPTRRYGDAMSEVGRRFERAGKAALAEQWELARYDLVELEELFENDVANALPPHDLRTSLAPAAEQFGMTRMVDLRQAIELKDPEAFRLAFGRAATTCNGCHAAVDRAFLVIPGTPGEPVPTIARPSVPATTP